MKKAIVTTTINPPTKALKKFIKIAKSDGWRIFIVTDKKTPEQPYYQLEGESPKHVEIVDPLDQEDISKELSDLIGWNCIQRRNFGLIAAYRWGAEIIATIDDDNIPLDNWGQDLAVGTTQEVDMYAYKPDVGPEYTVFDPLAATSQGANFWHRGFPVQLLRSRTRLDKRPEGTVREVKIQADLWDGAPDIDAICRMNKPGNVKFKVDKFYAGEMPGPFNSQNTFLAREVIPEYFLFPHIGRMDDIWASYYVQAKFPSSVVYGPPSVFQDRNDHDLVKDLEAEMIGYKYSQDFAKFIAKPPSLKDKKLVSLQKRHGLTFPVYFPAKAIDAFNIYKQCLKS